MLLIQKKNGYNGNKEPREEGSKVYIINNKKGKSADEYCETLYQKLSKLEKENENLTV